MDKSFAVPKNIQVHHMGPGFADLGSAIELEPERELASLDLDTNQTHFIQIKEMNEIDVRVTLKMEGKPEKPLTFKVALDETFEQLLEEVKRIEGITESLQFCQKPKADDEKPKPVKPKEAIASTCITLCQLLALDKAEQDKVMKDKAKR